jgi:hypothetical protein
LSLKLYPSRNYSPPKLSSRRSIPYNFKENKKYEKEKKKRKKYFEDSWVYSNHGIPRPYGIATSGL